VASGFVQLACGRRHRGSLPWRITLLALVAVIGGTASLARPVRALSGPNAAPTTGPDALIVVGAGGSDDQSQTSDAVNGWGDDQWQVTVSERSTITVSVTDEYIVGDNYTAYVDGSSIGTTPPEPIYGPTYSSGTFSTTVDAGTHLITVQDVGGIAYYNQGDTFMIPAGYEVAVSYAPAQRAGVTKVIFVHGIGADYTKPGFTALRSPLRDLALSYGAAYDDFAYAQDVGSGGDSNSSVGDNADKLYQEIVANYNAPTGGKTILIANSMGGAIVRGVMAKLGPSGAAMIDSVFFIEGAQSGSWLLLADAGTRDIPGWASPLIWGLRQAVTQVSAIKLDRPAVVDLTPGSASYRSINPAPIPDVPYFNTYGDITASIGACVFVCVSVGDLEIGDPLLLPGNPDPHSLDPLGGARFLPSPPDANHGEYRLSASVTYNVAALLAAPAFFALDVYNNPVSHFQLNGNVDKVNVAHCGSGQQISLANEYLNIISRRLAGFAQSCDPADITIH
jgi:hypothetical protein